MRKYLKFGKTTLFKDVCWERGGGGEKEDNISGGNAPDFFLSWH